MEGGGASGQVPNDQPPESQKDKGKRYLEKVAKLIPGEVVLGYQTLVAIVAGIKIEGAQPWFYWGAFVIGLIATPLYLGWMAEKDRSKKWHLIISSGSFIVWAYSISGQHLLPNCYDESIARFILVAYSILTGLKSLK